MISDAVRAQRGDAFKRVLRSRIAEWREIAEEDGVNTTTGHMVVCLVGEVLLQCQILLDEEGSRESVPSLEALMVLAKESADGPIEILRRWRERRRN